ncbi:MAG: 30S ribosomal protein S4 [Patescibacteria group bacterium]|nr:30S ribosomal protein S4 [Patescibacteria group bacterium]
MTKTTCKICRRLNQKLFLKGDRCSTPKCAFIRRPYPPGLKKKRGKSGLSEYGKELAEKQKLQKYYGLREKQFRQYVKDAMNARGKTESATLILAQELEKRLDNVVFRLGFAKSRREARRLVSHRHFLVNQKPVNISSFSVKKNDVISLKGSKENKVVFKNMLVVLKNYQPPAWLKIEKDKMQGQVVGEPGLESVETGVDISAIFEFYSR